MKKFKHQISFAGKITTIKSEDKDKLISLASKNENLNKILPKDVNLTNNIGFLLFTGESFVANVLNANSDGVRTEEAIKIANEFPLTYVDLNHKRDKLCGVVIAATYTDYNTGLELTEEQVRDSKDPFAVTVTGIIWKAANPELANAIENMNEAGSIVKDPIFLSWELAFDDIELITMNAKDNNFSDGDVITNPNEIEKLSKKLFSSGGNGLTEDGRKIGRIPIGDVVVLGVGLVPNPAANVAPIEVSNSNKLALTDSEAFSKIIQDKVEEILKNRNNIENSENKISQANEVVVKQDIKEIVTNIKSAMKIEKIDQLTDENLKDCKATELKEIFASSTKEIVDSKIKEISSEYVNKLTEKDKAIEAANKSSEELSNKLKDLDAKLSKASEDLQKVLSENAQREQVEAFSNRMNTIDESFDLDDKQKEIVANKVKALNSDSEFTSYLAEIEVLLAAKKKGKKPALLDKKDGDNDKENKTEDKKESKASVEDKTAVADALKNGEKDKTVIANTTENTETLASRAKKAFGLDGWIVTDKRKNRA